MIKKITITSEGDFNKITFSREKNSSYIDMEFNYHNGCRFSSFELEDMIKGCDFTFDREPEYIEMQFNYK